MNIPTLNEQKIKNAISEIESIDFQNISVEELEILLEPLFCGYKISAPRFEKGVYLYRGRICEKPNSIEDINYPPPSKINKLGRLNDIRETIFYGATAKGVPFFELDAKSGDKMAISVWKTTDKLLLNHVGFTSECTTLLNSNRRLDDIYDFVKVTNNFGGLNNLVQSYLASKFTESIPNGEEFRYKLTIAIGRKLMMGNLLNGVLYPTIAMSGNADNVAIKANFVETSMSFVSVQFVEITQRNGRKFKFDTIDSSTKLDREGKILWSGRNLRWVLKNQGEEFVMKAEGGDWVAYDTDGNRVDPE